MNKLLLGAICVCALAACSKNEEAAAPPPAAAAPAPKALVTGIEKANFDPAARPQDDLYRAVNGKWLATFEIPADKSNYGSFTKLADDSEARLKAIIEESASKPNRAAGSDEQKVGDLYASFMNEARAEELGIKPLESELARIDALKDKKELPAYIAHAFRIGAGTPIAGYIHQDAKDPTKYIVNFVQSGLSLPDRDYYLLNDAKFKEFRDKLAAHIAKMYELAGWKDGAKAAKSIMDLEAKIAKAEWSKVESRDAVKTYNPKSGDELKKMAPGFDWSLFLKEATVDGQPTYVISQPSYFTALDKLIAATPLPVWQSYFRWHLLSSSAPLLSKAFVDENFGFYGATLNGQKEIRPRWKRGVEAIENSLGEVVGRIYVSKHFPPQAKARMDGLVRNLLKAYEESFKTNDWMDEPTKQKAQEKIATFNPKIGYPVKWKDYSALTVAADDLYGNLLRSTEVEYQREVKKLGAPIDRDEWQMTPQTVNAYYNPELNEIVFPAAILQPPFFNLEADDAVNYGGIGAVIGHEIGHGFDDQGSKYDPKGAMTDWWSKETRAKFDAKAKALIEQYNGYEALPGQHVNGALTIGENLADIGGMSIAYKAYQISLGGKPAPVIDGLSGDQRFFMGWAQVWARKYRDENLLARLKTDPHSPSEYRCNGVVINMPGFASAFGVKEGDKLYKAPDQQIRVW